MEKWEQSESGLLCFSTEFFILYEIFAAIGVGECCRYGDTREKALNWFGEVGGHMIALMILHIIVL